jgi:hypothetical protein
MVLNLVAGFPGGTIATDISKATPRKGKFESSSHVANKVYTLVKTSDFPLETLPHSIISGQVTANIFVWEA